MHLHLHLERDAVTYINVPLLSTRSVISGSFNWRNFSSDALDVDFVLAYEEDSNTEKLRKREVFEANLKEVGLLLEKEERQRIHFVKIHVPRNVICQYAEILKLRLPLKTPDHIEPSKNFIASAINKCFDFLNVRLDEKKFPPKRNRLRAEFSRDKFYLKVPLVLLWYLMGEDFADY
ncbi:dimerization domain of Ca+-activated chloride-channel, anoctamin [Popillia japonica]|uniref:Dimerization domain of Ca+-activated chloride-channel, anoctamin n=1 Tax=Popillia japonica TaxID=7064 RepID=A0AAW1IUN5_POPJA